MIARSISNMLKESDLSDYSTLPCRVLSLFFYTSRPPEPQELPSRKTSSVVNEDDHSVDMPCNTPSLHRQPSSLFKKAEHDMPATCKPSGLSLEEASACQALTSSRKVALQWGDFVGAENSDAPQRRRSSSNPWVHQDAAEQLPSEGCGKSPTLFGTSVWANHDCLEHAAVRDGGKGHVLVGDFDADDEGSVAGLCARLF